MKRLCLLGMALAGLLTAGLTTVASATTTHGGSKPVKTRTASKHKPVTTKLTCKLALVTQIPADDTSVLQGAQAGTQYGLAGCGTPLFKGVEHDTYSLDTAGDLTGPYTQFFKTGTITGQFTLTPTEDVGPPSPTSFATQTYSGTATVTGGTGVDKGADGKGTLKCTTGDAAHYSCTEALSLVLVPGAAY